MPDQRFGSAVIATADLHWAAVEHQCPLVSAVGVGSVCGTVGALGRTEPGVVRVHTGDIDCEFAEQVFNDHFTMNYKHGIHDAVVDLLAYRRIP